MDTREYPPRPICAVGIVCFKDDAVLLIRRGKEPRRGEWTIPGGAVELGEKIRDAAVREFVEECGGEIELREVVDAADIMTRDEAGRVKYHYVAVDYWAEWKGGAFAAASDVMDARWVRSANLDAYALPIATRAVIEKALAARARE